MNTPSPSGAAGTSTALVPVEYLYALAPGRFDINDAWIPAHIVQYRIVRKTPKRIYYVVRESDGRSRPRVGCVNREQLEAAGEVYNRRAGWWADDFHLHLTPPVIVQPTAEELAVLRAEMLAAHPDRGGDHEAFVRARELYDHALGLRPASRHT